MLKVFRPQRALDLGPPVLAALERNEILPNGELFLFKLRPELTSELRAVLARIGDEDPAVSSGAHENVRRPLRTSYARLAQPQCAAASAYLSGWRFSADA